MLRLPPFTYLAPRSVEEAVNILAEHGPGAMLVAGGSDVYPSMKRGQRAADVLVSLSRIEELQAISGGSREGYSIGAGVTLAALANHGGIRTSFPALATAASLAGAPQLRSTGTIGGNVCLDTRCSFLNQSQEWREAIGFCLKAGGDVCQLAPSSGRCWAIASSDTPPVLCSISAHVRLVGPRGERVIPIAELYRDDGMSYMDKQPGEILTHVLLPPPDGLRSTYLKLRRREAFDFPSLGVAAALRSEGATIKEARIVLGAVASRPREAAEAGALLAGQALSLDQIERAAEAASQVAKPLDNADMHYLYRKKMARLFVKRALEELAPSITTDGDRPT